MSGLPIRANSFFGPVGAYAFLESASTLLDYAFQPIVDARSGETYGYEALLRNVGQMGFQIPLDVFDHAAHHDTMEDLELLLRKKAIKKFATLEGCSRAKLFLNIDARILEIEGYLLEETRILLDEQNISPSQVVLEMSEARDVSADKRQEDFTKVGRKLGFSIAVDDYGRGYSRMKTIYDLEPDILKIDRFFIDSINSDSRKKTLVKAVVDLAHVLGMRVVAEGVETEEELSICRDVGCDLIQGYLIARPFQNVEDARFKYTAIAKVSGKLPSRAKNTSEIINREIKPLVPLRDDARMEDVLALLRAGRANPFIPVINDSGEPRGLIREMDVKTFIYMPFGQDLLLNPIMSKALDAFTRRCPMADVHTPLNQLVEMIADEEDEAGGIIITKNSKYFGFLTTTALLKVSNEVRMRAAENQNPLTKLPGNSSIMQYVQQDAHSPEQARTFCYLDFDNFKPFNDVYGFAAGDRVLLLFSELLKRLVASDDVFAGHIGGDDFFLGARGHPLEDVRSMIHQLQEELRHQAESLYDAEDRRKGYIEAQDRHGVSRKFPLLTCSAAVLYLPAGLSVDRKDILGRQIAGLKTEAKASKDGIAISTVGHFISSDQLNGATA